MALDWRWARSPLTRCGNRTTHTGIQSAFGFTGNLVDATTGLLYLRARDYDAATGQFLSVDPAVDKTRQPYAYSGNNPVSRTDPSGLCPVNGGANVADCTPEDFGGASWLLSPVATFVGDGLRSPVGTAVSSFAIGIGDGASFGETARLREEWSPGSDCFVDKSGFYYAGVGVGVVGAFIATPFAISRVLGAAGRVVVAVRGAVSAVRGASVVAEASGAVAEGAEDLTIVGRWMSAQEHEAMLATGRVQEGTSGMTFVASPASIDSFLAQAASGSRYVEFGVPASALSAAGREGWAVLRGPGSMWAKHGLALSEMPIAQGIEWIASKL